MHKLVLTIPMVIVLCVPGPSVAEENGKGSVPSRTAKSQIFNVLDFGAVADDATDNTAAFSACLEALIAAGGGQIFLPRGVYRGRILIPPVGKTLSSWITIEIVGEGEPTPVFGTIGTFPLQNNGTIIRCLESTGPAVISVTSPQDSLYGGFSAVHIVLRNLEVRTYNDPAISGIDLRWALQCRLENVVINTGVYNVQAHQPTHQTYGLVTPACNNGALTILRNVVITGYHTGILVNEHTDGDSINLASNMVGLEFVFAHHASRFGRVGAQRCPYAIMVTGQHAFTIEELDIEIPGKGQTDSNNEWQRVIANIHDPDNLGFGEVKYWVVEGNRGAITDFVKKGGAFIQARRLGSLQ